MRKGTKTIVQFDAMNTAATYTTLEANESRDLKQHMTIKIIRAKAKQITATIILSFGSSINEIAPACDPLASCVSK